MCCTTLLCIYVVFNTVTINFGRSRFTHWSLWMIIWHSHIISAWLWTNPLLVQKKPCCATFSWRWLVLFVDKISIDECLLLKFVNKAWFWVSSHSTRPQFEPSSNYPGLHFSLPGFSMAMWLWNSASTCNSMPYLNIDWNSIVKKSCWWLAKYHLFLLCTYTYFFLHLAQMLDNIAINVKCFDNTLFCWLHKRDPCTPNCKYSGWMGKKAGLGREISHMWERGRCSSLSGNLGTQKKPPLPCNGGREKLVYNSIEM